jgi:SAM-dependent methyltransferase/NADH:ubiquinone oxidoreductase subunit 3 (subunit A)
MKKRVPDAALLAVLVVGMAGLAFCARRPALWPGMVGCAALSTALLPVLWKRRSVTTGQVLALAVLFRLMVIGMPPTLSDDAHRYVWDGLVQREGMSPYVHRPSAKELKVLHSKKIYSKLNSEKYYSVYPPVSEMVFWMGGQFYEAGASISYYIIKCIFALFEVAAVFLLARMVAARDLMLYAWQPLAVLEAAGQGHTEAACVFFLVATVWACRKGRPALAGAALAGAGGVKLFPLVLLPFLGQRMGRRTLWGASAALVLMALPYASREAGAHLVESLRLYVQLFEFNAGPYYALKGTLLALTGEDWSKTLGPLLSGVFLCGLPVLYTLDRAYRPSLAQISRLALGLFLALATTVHPWYLLVVLALVPFARSPRWHWHALALGSVGTYLFYTRAGWYWPFVALGWGGWLALALREHGEVLLQGVLRLRAQSKARWLQSYLPEGDSLRLLDVGAGEGYVGERLARRHSVQLVDAREGVNRTALSFQRADGADLPFADDAFDAALLAYVLHHTREPEAVLREALRVSRNGVVVLESGCRGRWCRLLRRLDRWANRLRRGGSEGHAEGEAVEARFRSAREWERMAERCGGRVTAREEWGAPWHRKMLLRIAK